MRTITVKYQGECKKCGAILEIGQQAEYEKTTGIFCVGHFPTDTEEIRAYRQERADRKADKYEEWAAKRRQKADAVFEHNKPMTSDWAFITQPGYIPARARIIAQEDRQYESLQVAKRMEQKAESLRHVRVKGDAEKHWQTKRGMLKAVLKPGMKVIGLGSEPCEVLKVNTKTAKIKGNFGDYNQDLALLRLDTTAMTEEEIKTIHDAMKAAVYPKEPQQKPQVKP